LKGRGFSRAVSRWKEAGRATFRAPEHQITV